MAAAFSLRRAALGAAVLSACVPCFAAAAQPLPTPAQLAALAFPGWSESDSSGTPQAAANSARTSGSDTDR